MRKVREECKKDKNRVCRNLYRKWLETATKKPIQ